MSTRHMNIPQMWVIGSFAVYAKNLSAARQACDEVRIKSETAPFGTIRLDTGEEIDWINMRFNVNPRNSPH